MFLCITAENTKAWSLTDSPASVARLGAEFSTCLCEPHQSSVASCSRAAAGYAEDRMVHRGHCALQLPIPTLNLSRLPPPLISPLCSKSTRFYRWSPSLAPPATRKSCVFSSLMWVCGCGWLCWGESSCMSIAQCGTPRSTLDIVLICPSTF